jgi:2'-hydroxyisoflavone reductase
MRVLVIGGTRFVGRHMAEAAVARGHDVTVFHRGKTGTDVVPEATHILGDRDHDLHLLADGHWDATIDACAYVPRQVAELAAALGDRSGQLAFVSTVSVYAEPMPNNSDENAPMATLDDPTTEVVDDKTYGGLKVLCEQVALDRFGPNTLIVRPTYVVGPHDYTHRFTYWVERIAAGGRVLAPEPRDYGIQVIDARDQATWTIEMLEKQTAGAFHTVSPPPPFTFEDMLKAIVEAVGPDGTSLEWVDSAFLTDHGVDGNELPLWAEGIPDDPGMACDPSRVLAAGLSPRPLAQTITETLAHERAGRTPGGEGTGMSRERETELLTAWSKRS